MIHVVDDEPGHLAAARDALSRDFDIRTFGSAREALDAAASEAPDLVLTDITMPDMDGYEFRKAFCRRFPSRLTPFVYLTSRTGTSDIVRGLEAGADDYLAKPIDPNLLRAKIRSVLGRKARYSRPVFQGDLGQLPFIKVLHFCEQHGLTGEVEFQGPGVSCRLPFKGGLLVPGAEEGEDDVIGELYELEQGTFTIRAAPLDFSDITSSASRPSERGGRPGGERPMGRLSGVSAGGRILQIQTEFVALPEDQILTVVVSEGNTILKRHSKPPADADREALERLIASQHEQVEAEVRQRVEDLTQKKSGAQTSVRERYYRLFEEGIEAFQRRDYQKARDLWQQALRMNPGDGVLETNLRVVEQKLSP